MPPLSILDLSPVTTAISGAQALRNSLDLARHADALGYTRYWVAEHHNLSNIASSAPDIMIGQIAAVTSRMRVGSGGVMLPNHAPLTVAERFKVLEALFPSRIDLGIGRAPGTDPVTSVALRRRQDIRDDDDFLERLQELLLLESKGFPDSHPFSRVRAMPSDVALPPLFLLGSSDYSAKLAASIGAGFSFAHHFASHDAADAMQTYRANFRPSPLLAKPYAILAVAAVCAETADDAERIAATADLNIVRRAKGDYLPLESPETALAFPYTPIDRDRMAQNRERLLVGTPDAAKARLMSLADATAADEIMVTGMIYDHAARKNSYALLAKAFGLQVARALFFLHPPLEGDGEVHSPRERCASSRFDCQRAQFLNAQAFSFSRRESRASFALCFDLRPAKARSASLLHRKGGARLHSHKRERSAVWRG